MSCRAGYGYWARGSGPWAVWASKKSARAISNANNKQEITFEDAVIVNSFIKRCLKKFKFSHLKFRYQWWISLSMVPGKLFQRRHGKKSLRTVDLTCPVVPILGGMRGCIPPTFRLHPPQHLASAVVLIKVLLHQ